MNVVVTGSNGQVGYCLVNRLKGLPDVNLIALDRAELDISDEKAVKNIIEQLKPDVIINAAAYTAVDLAESNQQECFAINADGPKYLSIAADRIGALLLHISTDYVFNGEASHPYDEMAEASPVSVYGQSKLAGELAIKDFCSRYAILRTAWVFGEHGNNFVKTMLRLAQNRPELSVVGDQFGGPTYAGDIADALIQMMVKMTQNTNSDLTGVYHFSGQPYVSWYQFATEIFDASEKHGLIAKKPTVNCIVSSEYPTAAPRPKNSKLSCEKITTHFGIAVSDWKKQMNNIQEYSK